MSYWRALAVVEPCSNERFTLTEPLLAAFVVTDVYWAESFSCSECFLLPASK